MALEVEWNRFVDLCLEEDRKRKIPLGIVADPHMGAVLVLRADDISVAREMTAAECLHHIARQDISMSVLLLESRLHSSLRDNQDALQLLLQLFDLLPSVFSDASIHRRISELMDEAAATDGDSTVAQIVYRICEDETLREPLASLAVTLEAEFGSLLDLLLEREVRPRIAIMNLANCIYRISSARFSMSWASSTTLPISVPLRSPAPLLPMLLFTLFCKTSLPARR